jgi:hypothetical protein
MRRIISASSAFLCLLFFGSCLKEDPSVSNEAFQVKTRNTNNMMVSFQSTVDKKTTLQCSRVKITYLNASYLTITLNPGSLNQQSFNCVSVSISEVDGSLKITHDNSLPIINKSFSNASIGNSTLTNQIGLPFQTANASTIIIEEDDSI